MDERPKIEVIRVSSIERRNFRPLDGVQLRAAYSHVRVGTYCPQIDNDNEMTNLADNKPPISGGRSRRFKTNLGPVSRLLRRRHQGTGLFAKSCDNIYNAKTSSDSIGQSATERALQARRSSSLDWRAGRRVDEPIDDPAWPNSSHSAEQICSTSGFRTHSTTRSKIVSLLRRLSPRLSRNDEDDHRNNNNNNSNNNNNNNNKERDKRGRASATNAYPWIKVEYSSNDETTKEATKPEDSRDSDLGYQRELRLNELRKRMLACSASPSSPLGSNTFVSQKPRYSDGGRNKEYTDSGIGNQSEQSIDSHRRVCETVREDRSTAEDRKSNREDSQTRRRHPHRGPGHGEVAGLEEVEEDDATIVNETIDRRSESLASRKNSRPRPVSLAVQPLNYQRLDPDDSSSNEGDAISKRRVDRFSNMTSQESIGDCSLDVDRSASDRSEATLGSVSEKTLHSLNLSCNGKARTPEENLSNGSNGTLQKEKEKKEEEEKEVRQEESNLGIERVNGEKRDAEPEQQQQLTSAKKPSYLGLACSISGYSGITRYDSKLREGFRSRDSSPGSRLVTRETSPAGFRSSDNLGVPGLSRHPPKSQSISPLAMDRRNGFGNGNKECRTESFGNSCQGYSEVDRGLRLRSNFPDASPIRSTSPVKRTPGAMQISWLSRETGSYTSSISVSSPRSGHAPDSDISFGETSFVNGSSMETMENQSLNVSSSSEKSFIQQRVERLYGPGALAQGFFFKRSSVNSSTNETSLDKSRGSCNDDDRITDNANTEESLKNLPVLRHLRPEFRAQLPVVGPRKATDGTEQLVKPLQRISVTPERKNETNIEARSNTIRCEPREKDSIKLSASATSIPDQQPAAPEVVLPVLETSASSKSIATAEQTFEPTENPVEEKHGHHFMRLLNAERDRLLILAESAEAELANAAPDTLPEEAEGKLRSAAGKARLLAKQKMQQFEGLCHKNIIQVPGEKFPTTYEDLAGFWDMVMLQVVQVNDIFAQIEKLKSCQWQEITQEKKLPGAGNSRNGNSTKRRPIGTQRPKTTTTATTANPATEANKKVREAREQARRKMMEDRRRAMRANAGKDNDRVTIFAPET